MHSFIHPDILDSLFSFGSWFLFSHVIHFFVQTIDQSPKTMKSSIFLLFLGGAAALSEKTPSAASAAGAHKSMIKDKMFTVLDQHAALIHIGQGSNDERRLQTTCPPELQDLFEDAFYNEQLSCSCQSVENGIGDRLSTIGCESCLLCHRYEDICATTSLSVSYASKSRDLSVTSCVDARAYETYEGEMCVTISGNVPVDPGFGVDPDGRPLVPEVDPDFGLDPPTLRCYATLNGQPCASCDIEECEDDQYDLGIDCSNVVPGRIFPACLPDISPAYEYGISNPLLRIDPGYDGPVDPGFSNPDSVDPGYGNPNTPLLANMTVSTYIHSNLLGGPTLPIYACAGIWS